MSEESNTPVESTEGTAEAVNVETQQSDSQPEQQADTTKETKSVTDSMAIEAPEETENSPESQVTIDSIVAEALEGELSEETKALLSESDLKHIDMLVEGHKAIQEKNNQEVFDVVGGEDSYKELQEWGRNNMSQEQQEAFNTALFSGDMNLAKLAVQGLQAQYVAANGKSPDRFIEGGESANEDSRPYSSVEEYINEARSYEYKSNPAYRAKVEAKRNISGF